MIEGIDKDNNKKAYTAVLFDKDGVLIDSLDTCFEALNVMLNHYNRPEISKDWFVRELWGMKPGTQSEWLNGPISEAEERERVDYYHRARDEMEHRTKLFPHTVDVLSSLKKSGRFKIGLVTSTERRTTVPLLKRFDLSGFFDTVVCGEEAEPKPSPEPIILACKRLNVEVADVLYVGDTDVDIIAGKSAGCDTAIVATSHKIEELVAISGIVPIKDLRAVLVLVGIGLKKTNSTHHYSSYSHR